MCCSLALYIGWCILHNAVSVKYIEFLIASYIALLMCDILIVVIEYAIVIM